MAVPLAWGLVAIVLIGFAARFYREFGCHMRRGGGCLRRGYLGTKDGGSFRDFQLLLRMFAETGVSNGSHVIKFYLGSKYKPLLRLFFWFLKLLFMNEKSLVPAHEARIAALGGFLQGISFLNRNHQTEFAEAFVINARDDRQVPSQIRSRFSHLPGLAIRPDDSFHGGIGQLEKDIGSLLLIDPLIDNEQITRDLRAYLSLMIMDRLDDIINDWERLEDDAELLEYLEPKRFIGTHEDIRGTMIFYLLRSVEVCFIVYISNSTKIL